MSRRLVLVIPNRLTTGGCWRAIIRVNGLGVTKAVVMVALVFAMILALMGIMVMIMIMVMLVMVMVAEDAAGHFHRDHGDR